MIRDNTKDVNSIKLHIYEEITNFCSRLRVNEGWIYIFYTDTGHKEEQIVSTNFVPDSNIGK